MHRARALVAVHVHCVANESGLVQLDHEVEVGAQLFAGGRLLPDLTLVLAQVGYDERLATLDI